MGNMEGPEEAIRVFGQEVEIKFKINIRTGSTIKSLNNYEISFGLTAYSCTQDWGRNFMNIGLSSLV